MEGGDSRCCDCDCDGSGGWMEMKEGSSTFPGMNTTGNVVGLVLKSWWPKFQKSVAGGMSQLCKYR